MHRATHCLAYLPTHLACSLTEVGSGAGESTEGGRHQWHTRGGGASQWGRQSVGWHRVGCGAARVCGENARRDLCVLAAMQCRGVDEGGRRRRCRSMSNAIGGARLCAATSAAGRARLVSLRCHSGHSDARKSCGSGETRESTWAVHRLTNVVLTRAHPRMAALHR